MATHRAFRTITGATTALLALAAGCSSGSPSGDLAVVGQAAPALALINEVLVNPYGQDEAGLEYVELKGTAGGSLEDVYVVVADGSGDLTLIVNLGEACDPAPCTFGPNGLLVIGAPANLGDAPAETTVVDGTALDASAPLDNTATSVVLFESTDAIGATAGDAYADLPNGIDVLDAVGFGTDVSGGVDLGSDAVRAMSRLGNTANSADAWYYCEGVSAELLCSDTSANAPTDAVLTPGDANIGAAQEPIGAGGSAGASSVAGATSTAGSAPVAEGGSGGAEPTTAGTAPTTVAGAAGTLATAQGGAAEAGAAGAAGQSSVGTGGVAASSGGTGTGATSSGGSATGGSAMGGGTATGGTATGGAATGGAATGGAPTGGSETTVTGGSATSDDGSQPEAFEADEDSGCGCRTAGQRSSGSGVLALLAAAMLFVRRSSHR